MLLEGAARVAVSSAVRGGGSKKAMARTSIDLRGGASGGEAGSVKAVWKTKREPSTFLSYTWTQGRVAAWSQGRVVHLEAW